MEYESNLDNGFCVISDRLQFFRGTDPSKKVSTCLVPRAALLKTMLNFLKKALQDPAFSESVRHFMDGSLPTSLTHIISNAEYYGPSLFLLATNVITVCVFQEPSLLSTFQDNGLTDFVFHALLVKDVSSFLDCNLDIHNSVKKLASEI